MRTDEIFPRDRASRSSGAGRTSSERRSEVTTKSSSRLNVNGREAEAEAGRGARETVARRTGCESLRRWRRRSERTCPNSSVTPRSSTS
jgi:hypothetical protein